MDKERLLRVLRGLMNYQIDWREDLRRQGQTQLVEEKDTQINMLNTVIDVIEDEGWLEIMECGLAGYIDMDKRTKERTK